jgi:predicted DNA-binding transcriptional regulator YafY
MSSPVTRLLAALDALQSRPGITAAQLAERLRVDGRSVRRYITTLQDMGMPVEAVRGRYGGYRLRPGFKLPPLMLTEDEALAVTLGLLAARRLGLAGAVPAVEGALAKIERVLPQALRARVQAVQDTVALDLTTPASPPVAPAADRLALLSAAAHQGQRVWLRYRRGDGGETERLLDPYGLVYHEGRWYVVGYCHLRQETRVFRLDRVLQAAPRAETFARPAGFDSLEYALRAFAAIPDRWLVEVLLETTMERVRWLVPLAFATLEETGDGIILRAYDRDLDHAARFLISLGCPLVVRQPPELLDALRGVAEAILHSAQRKASCQNTPEQIG